MAKRELPATIRDRYRISSNRKKSRILDEFIAITGHHRNHGVRLLGRLDDDEHTTRPVSPNPPKRWSLALTPCMMGKGRRTGLARSQ